MSECIGMSEYWAARIFGCLNIAVSRYLDVGILVCGNIRMLEFLMLEFVCLNIGVSQYWSVEILDFGNIGVSKIWGVGIWGCRNFGVSEF